MYILGMSPVTAFVAIVPAIILLVYVYKLDRLEKEPTGLLVQLALFGIAITIPAAIIEDLGDFIISYIPFYSVESYNAVYYFIVVALTEELAKYAVVYLRTRNETAFNCRFDGIVYTVFVSLGFALAENIKYVQAYGISTALLRAVTSIPGHACFGVFMGVWYGHWRYYSVRGDYSKAKLCSVMGLVIPVLIHGGYDYIISTESSYYSYEIMFILYIAVMFLLSLRLAKKSAKKDRYV